MVGEVLRVCSNMDSAVWAHKGMSAYGNANHETMDSKYESERHGSRNY